MELIDSLVMDVEKNVNIPRYYFVQFVVNYKSRNNFVEYILR